MRVWMVALVAAALAEASVHPAPATTAPSDVVHVDAVAVDARGRSVETLKAGDLELREDGFVRPIDDVRFVKIDPVLAAGEAVAPIASEADERAAAAQPNTRLVAFYLDDYHVSPASTERVRTALHQFVDHELGPRDLVVVMRPLDSLLTIRLTRDRAAVHRVINTFRGRLGDYEPANDLERSLIAKNHAGADAQRTQATWSSLNALVIHLANLGSARKTLLLVSERANPVVQRRGFESLPTSSFVVRAANRSNVSLYVLDPREAGAQQVPEGPDLLKVMADDTGGEVIAGAGDPGVALRRMIADASAYYMVTYRTQRAGDGMFHAVELKAKKPGVSIRARKGFDSLSADEIQRLNLLAKINEPKPPPKLEPMRHQSALIRPWFGLSRGDSGRTRVTFVWEAAGQLIETRTVRSPSRIVLKVVTADGTSVFDGVVRPSTATAIDGPGQAVRAVFDAPPGRLRLQMSIEDATAREIDSDVRDLVVRELRGPVVIGTPEVVRARTARDVRLIEGDPAVAPVAAREFSRSESLIIRVPAYGEGDAAPVISARLASRGRPLRDLVVDPENRPDGRRHIHVPLSSLGPGEYSIEITAVGPQGEARDAVAFRVTN